MEFHSKAPRIMFISIVIYYFMRNLLQILMAEGEELKRWNALSNILRYDRTTEQENRERAYYNRNKKSEKHVAKMFPSFYT